MRIVIPGGTGHLGQTLVRHFRADGHEVQVLTRRPRGPGELAWDGETLGPWTEAIDGADVVVNLAGRTVNCRYSVKNLREMLDSRVSSTRVLGEAIAAAQRPPRLWLQSSTATLYAHRFDAPNDERTGLIGGDEPDVPLVWSSSVAIAKSWEREAVLARTPNTRRVLLRSSVVLGVLPGSIFDIMATLARRGLGGTAGDGRQYVSWIHEADFVRAVDFLIGTEGMDGPVNVCSPGPVRNRDFNRTLRRAVGAPFGLPATRWMLELGAFFLRTETELVLKSRFVVPTRLLEAGFRFDFPHWAAAAAELAGRWRGRRALDS